MAGRSDDIGALGHEARRYLAEARRVAIAEFGQEKVADIPRLVTDVAMLMATLAADRADGRTAGTENER
ncbi:MAG: hypothetical protein AAF577_01070 [Pseudomonadota bacterium]